jgi:hypothetical protein
MAIIIGFDESKKEKFTCSGTRTDPGCGAIVVYTKSDILKYEGKDYSGGADGQEWVNCPGCQKKHILRSW